ncbi:DUF1294 domain-containing protein [Streptococcus ictaluri]|uniref:PF06961 family protein n=1 Tax=Streptococcus ictaluri 707-05 TaxID=764299 RepID=G5K617_9STRE|nr:DUF1294 domain-containing protein [Streptococcus ictaluri]EHI68590.1 hypothetical protein STRIC_0504 [Streptococcus ictaluri 707-05]
MSLSLILVLLIWNLVVFAIYGMDKRKAIKGDWRIAEKHLLIMTLFMGGLGALLAGKLFHHKTKKWYFQIAWWLGIVILIAFSYYFYQLTRSEMFSWL